MVDLDDRILIAVPKKGRLKDETISYLKRIGLKFRKRDRFDIALCKTTPMALIFLPAKDIPIYVTNGKVSYGITGQDMIMERDADVDEVLKLGFGKCRLCIAAPKIKKYKKEDLAGKTIATSFPVLTKKYYKDNFDQTDVNIRKISGSVEITPTLGIADLVVDLVETGSTLKESGLEIIDTIMNTEAVFLARKNLNDFEKEWLNRLTTRLIGILTAEKHLIIDYNISKNNLEKAEKLTPGMKAPTVMALEQKNWFAVRSVINKSDMHELIEALNKVGAEAILVSKMEYFQK